MDLLHYQPVVTYWHQPRIFIFLVVKHSTSSCLQLNLQLEICCKTALLVARGLFSWHNSSCEKSSTINTLFMSLHLDLDCVIRLRLKLFFSVNLVWDAVEASGLVSSSCASSGYQATAAPPLLSSLSSVSSLIYEGHSPPHPPCPSTAPTSVFLHSPVTSGQRTWIKWPNCRRRAAGF